MKIRRSSKRPVKNNSIYQVKGFCGSYVVLSIFMDVLYELLQMTSSMRQVNNKRNFRNKENWEAMSVT